MGNCDWRTNLRRKEKSCLSVCVCVFERWRGNGCTQITTNWASTAAAENQIEIRGTICFSVSSSSNQQLFFIFFYLQPLTKLPRVYWCSLFFPNQPPPEMFPLPKRSGHNFFPFLPRKRKRNALQFYSNKKVLIFCCTVFLQTSKKWKKENNSSVQVFKWATVLKWRENQWK